MISKSFGQYKCNRASSKGFTIVELLVVIVVIGVLAAITIVSYTGISQRAAAAALEADLKNASTQLEMYKAENGTYPSNADGLSSSDGTSYQYTVSDGNYYLSATSTAAGSTAYYVSSETGAVLSGVWSGHLAPGQVAWKKVATGGNHSCAINSAGQAYCWGFNNNGQLGNNSTTDSSTPVAVNTSGVLGGKTILEIAPASQHTCALASDHNVYCWGWGDIGQLGDNLSTTSWVPVAVDKTGVLSGKTVKALAVAEQDACVIASDDKLYCWGNNWAGILGDGSDTRRPAPVAVDTSGVLSGKTIASIKMGAGLSCALDSNSVAYCWGYNSYGQLGDNSTTERHSPVLVDTSLGALAGKTIKSIYPGSEFNCAIASDDQVYCWGYNNHGQLGNNSTTNSQVPVAVNTSGALSGKTVASIASGNYGVCAVASDSNAYCWGLNDSGQLGIGLWTDSHVPVAVNTAGVLSGKTIHSIYLNYTQSCAVASDNEVYCWGRNEYGQLGNSSTTNSNVPVAVTIP